MLHIDSLLTVSPRKETEMKEPKSSALCFITILVILLGMGGPLTAITHAFELTPMEQLGKSIFFDQNLSINQNQSCAVCHTPEAGWTGPNSEINNGGAVYEGSILGRFGDRRPPSSAYATSSPVLHYVIEKKEAVFVGGNFWDGRATGEKLGNPAADQAQGPFLNPMEQALPDSACVVYRVCTEADYTDLFKEMFGEKACNITWPADINSDCSNSKMVDLSDGDRINVETAYDNIAIAIATYEGSSESNAYTSKFDYYLVGKVDLTKEEKKGLNLFKGKGKCANCHILAPGPNGEPPLFTDFTYDNLGVSRNPENPWYNSEFNPLGYEWVDGGLGNFLKTRPEYVRFWPENYGKQKVPTLRNVDKRPYPDFVKAYMHNGYFKDLRRVVEFYSERDKKPVCSDPFTTDAQAQIMDCWPEPEVADNVNAKELGKLNLTDDQIDAIVAFMKTLSDGYKLHN
jgi:cytochrome c peroxidase